MVEGYDFAPTFSIWTTIEECLNPPVIWEKDRGWFTTEPFSEPEVFEFPEGIGPVECVNVEHEEVLLDPALGRLQARDVQVRPRRRVHQRPEDARTCSAWTRPGTGRASGAWRSRPRDVVAACLPDPAHLGDRMHGKTCAGTWVKGTSKDGQPREVYLYHVADNETLHGASTASRPSSGRRRSTRSSPWSCSPSGAWKGAGVLGPEAFDPDPFLELMPKLEFPMGTKEIR